jgi:glycine oxidase
MDDVLIIGGGVIGLSLAYELSGRGIKVRVLERDAAGRAASWAGAGIVPAASGQDGQHPHHLLAGLSCRLHAQWSERLREATGIDTGYVRCGGLYLATDTVQLDALALQSETMRRAGIPFETVDSDHIAELDPVLSRAAYPRAAAILGGAFSPGEAQIRNPRHMRALRAACAAQGVRIDEFQPVEECEIRGGRVESVRTPLGRCSAEAVVLTTGCWSGVWAHRLGVRLAVRPVRGQIVLLDCHAGKPRRVINVGPRYLVPRRDGRLLVGSTEEDAGFAARTTAKGVSGLLNFALELVPALADARLERCWAGLRPGTADGLPYLGRLPGLKNAYVATGHFRSGLQLSPGTAIVMSQLIRGQPPEIDLTPFRVDRGS